MGDQIAEKSVTSYGNAPNKVANAIVPSPEKRLKNKFALACAILASMTSVLLGYDIGVMTGAVIFIKKDLKLNDTKVEVLMGILSLYTLFGAAAAGRTSDRIGRRYTIVVAAVIFFVGALMMGFAINYAFLMAGRFVAGVGVGFALMIAPVYTAELSPASRRGFLSSLPEVFINVGILLGYVSNFAFAHLPTFLNWRIMLGVGAIPSVILAIGAFILPESPRWLVMQGCLGEARRVLLKTSDTKDEAELRLSDIKEAVGIPQDCTSEVVTVPKHRRGEGVWRDLLFHSTPSVRRAIIVAVVIHFFQRGTGINSVVLYSPRIFGKAGIKSKNGLLGATVAVGFTKTIFILVATFLMDRFGRRPLLLISTTGVIISLLGLGFGLTVIEHNPHEKQVWAIALSITTVLTFVAMFSIGIGPAAWVYSTEIIPLRFRAQGMSLAVAAGSVTSGTIGMTYISLYNAITIGGTYFMFTGVAILAWIFFYTFLPETQGKTLEEMETLFEKDGVNQSQLQLGPTDANTACIATKAASAATESKQNKCAEAIAGARDGSVPSLS